MVRRISMVPGLAALALCAATAGAQSVRRVQHPSRVAHPSRAVAPGPWHPVYRDRVVAVSIDPGQTRLQSDGTYETRLRWQYTANRAIGRNEFFRTLVERRLIDCKSLGSKTVSARTFTAAGRPVSGFDTPRSDLRYMSWATRPPGSSSARALAAVCGAVRK